MENCFSIGLDLGTTTISAVVVDTRDGTVLARETVKSEADLRSSVPGEKIQDAAKIAEKARSILDNLLSAFPETGSIGITGQMHGIVYLDPTGNLLSPLYTWQDQQAAPYCEELQQKTGFSVSPGYGLATHYALKKAGHVPTGAAGLCTVMDYLGFLLTGERKIHSTNAASLGFFDRSDFDADALVQIGTDRTMLPDVVSDAMILGTYRGIPVAVAIGDNQASFLGSVADPETMALANFGTGSQISRMTESRIRLRDPLLEQRPLLNGKTLTCGSALCGGRAYALWEQFVRSLTGSTQTQYAQLNALAEEGLQIPDLPKVYPAFCGTRADAAIRGRIENLSEENFTPAALTAGLLLGMAEELHAMFLRMPGSDVTQLIASGNGVRKNTALVKALEQVFGMPVRIPAHQEEAAFGAALFAAGARGMPVQQLQKNCIHYL